MRVEGGPDRNAAWLAPSSQNEVPENTVNGVMSVQPFIFSVPSSLFLLLQKICFGGQIGTPWACSNAGLAPAQRKQVASGLEMPEP